MGYSEQLELMGLRPGSAGGHGLLRWSALIRSRAAAGREAPLPNGWCSWSQWREDQRLSRYPFGAKVANIVAIQVDSWMIASKLAAI